MANNVTREEHLQSLASAAQQFALSTQNDTLSLVIEAFQAASTSLTTPTLSLGSWSKADTTYTASLSYSGDGNLSTNIGSISGTTLSVTDEDGSFNGVVTATAGTSFAATTLNFSYTEEAGGGGSNTPETLYLAVLNGQGAVIGTTAITKYTYEQARAALTDDFDLNELENAYEMYQAIEVAHEGFCWLAGNIVEEDFAYAIYGFATQISEPEVHTNAAPMDVVGTASPYYARLTHIGIALWVQASE